MTSHLQSQIERIIDEGEGNRRKVIVEMSEPAGLGNEMLEITAEVHKRRSMAVSARDLLPVSFQELNQISSMTPGKLTVQKQTRIRAEAAASLATQLAAIIFPQTRNYLHLVEELLKSPIVSKAISELGASRRSGATRPRAAVKPAFLKRSGSLILNLSKDELPKLPSEVPGIKSVFPNHPLRLPRTVESSSVPPEIQDEKAAAWGIRRIGALSAWGAFSCRGDGVKVAILDTGVDAGHPDLKGRVEGWAEFDTDGFQVAKSTPHDAEQHGTHCAGIIAGGNDSGRWIGVAPECRLYVAKVLGGSATSYGQILAAMEWALDQGCDVMNLSLGGMTLEMEAPDPYTRLLRDALLEGVPVVTAIGNDGAQTTGSPGNDWFAFSVGATDYRDRAAGFSGGRTHVVTKSRYLGQDKLPLVYSKPEVCAPGVSVLSSIPGQKGDRKHAILNGTSMAAPHVSGAIALLLSATNIRTLPKPHRALLVQDLLTGSVDELGECGQDHRFGFGRIDVLRAIGFAREKGYWTPPT